MVTLTDCVGTTSTAGNTAAIEITYPFFSTPMNAASFLTNLKDGAQLAIHGPPPKRSRATDATAACPQPPQQQDAEKAHPRPSYGFRAIAGNDVFQAPRLTPDTRHYHVMWNRP